MYKRQIVTRVFYNYGDNTFALGGVPSEITERCGAINLVDINGDGTLDVASFGWQNDWKNAYAFNDLSKSNIQENTAPAAPTNLKVESMDGKVILTWSKATDDHTPQEALRYNVYVKNNADNTVYALSLIHISFTTQLLGKDTGIAQSEVANNAVSYTHLDVYKRQQYLRIRRLYYIGRTRGRIKKIRLQQ